MALDHALDPDGRGREGDGPQRVTHPAHQVVAAQADDDGVVVLGEAVHAAAHDDGVASTLLVEALPEGRARLGDLGRVRLDLAELAHVIEQQSMVEISVVQTIGQRPADLVTTTSQQASDGHHWHVSLRAPMRTSFAGFGSAAFYHRPSRYGAYSLRGRGDSGEQAGAARAAADARLLPFGAGEGRAAAGSGVGRAILGSGVESGIVSATLRRRGRARRAADGDHHERDVRIDGVDRGVGGAAGEWVEQGAAGAEQEHGAGQQAQPGAGHVPDRRPGLPASEGTAALPLMSVAGSTESRRDGMPGRPGRPRSQCVSSDVERCRCCPRPFYRPIPHRVSGGVTVPPFGRGSDHPH